MKDLFTEIWESIRRNKLRTCLTGFSVSWGIFMIIVLLGAGNGLMNSFMQDSSSFNANTMSIYGGYTSKPYNGLKKGRAISLKQSDMEMLARNWPEVIDEVTTVVSRSGYNMNLGKKSYSMDLCGTFPGHQTMNNVKVVAGRFINANDIAEQRKVIVISHMCARNMLSGGRNYSSLIGKRVRVGDMLFKVIGIYHSEENTDDRSQYIPYTTAGTLFGLGDDLTQITFTFHGLESNEENEAFEKRIKAALNSRHGADPTDNSAIWIWNRFTQQLQMQQGTDILRKGLWIIGIFTLLGGVVGVSNIMLITVRERTHEFGIRKAIGAGPWQITKLIMTESVAITALFGYIGMVLGMISCEILDRTVGQNAVDVMGQSIRLLVNPTVGIDVAIKSTILLVIAGTIAGLIPARKASKVRPIEALRAD